MPANSPRAWRVRSGSMERAAYVDAPSGGQQRGQVGDGVQHQVRRSLGEIALTELPGADEGAGDPDRLRADDVVHDVVAEHHRAVGRDVHLLERRGEGGSRRLAADHGLDAGRLLESGYVRPAVELPPALRA